MPVYAPTLCFFKGKYYIRQQAWQQNYRATLGKIDGSSLGQRARFLVRYRKGKRSSPFFIAEIGFPVSFGTSKVYNSQPPANADLATRTLHVGEITAILKQTIALEIDLRERNIVNCIGWKIQWELSHTINTIEFFVFNWVIIAPKGKQGVPNATDFFRNRGGSRGIDFGIVLHLMFLNNNKINDDLYDIVTHRRVTLGPANTPSTVAYPQLKTQHLIDTWVPLNRQLRYDAQEGCISPVYVVYWLDHMVNNNGQFIVTSVLRSQKSIAIHYKESL